MPMPMPSYVYADTDVSALSSSERASGLFFHFQNWGCMQVCLSGSPRLHAGSTHSSFLWHRSVRCALVCCVCITNQVETKILPYYSLLTTLGGVFVVLVLRRMVGKWNWTAFIGWGDDECLFLSKAWMGFGKEEIGVRRGSRVKLVCCFVTNNLGWKCSQLGFFIYLKNGTNCSAVMGYRKFIFASQNLALSISAHLLQFLILHIALPG